MSEQGAAQQDRKLEALTRRVEALERSLDWLEGFVTAIAKRLPNDMVLPHLTMMAQTPRSAEELRDYLTRSHEL